MKVAIISPIPLLEEYATLSDGYHLALSSIARQSSEYLQFYRRCSDRGEFVILDNSAHELGIGDLNSDFFDLAREMSASEIALPDRLFFGDDTLEMSECAAATARQELPGVRLMGVPQGRTIEEWRSCLLGLVRLGVDTIGISKDYEVWPGGLGHLIRTIIAVRHIVSPAIHLLGWGRLLGELFELATGGYSSEIRGIDSAKPLTYAALGLSLPHNPFSLPPKYPRRPHNFFHLSEIDSQIATENCYIFKTWAHGELPSVSDEPDHV